MRRIRVRPNHIFAVLLASFAVALYAELEWYIARGRLVEKIYGHAPHRIPCKDWPAPQEAEKALADNADRVRALADAGLRLEIIVSLKCACKAQYGVSRAAGVRHSEVKTIIGDRKRLFGIPYEPLDDSAGNPRRCAPPEKTPSANSLARADMSRDDGRRAGITPSFPVSLRPFAPSRLRVKSPTPARALVISVPLETASPLRESGGLRNFCFRERRCTSS